MYIVHIKMGWGCVFVILVILAILVILVILPRDFTVSGTLSQGLFTGQIGGVHIEHIQHIGHIGHIQYIGHIEHIQHIGHIGAYCI